MPLHIPEMNEERAPSKEQARVFHQLLEAIEAVRLLRQQEYRDRPHPQLKRFTQQELNDEACPTYKNWLIGRSHRLPSRSMLMQIADYLECSLSERNDLLLACKFWNETVDFLVIILWVSYRISPHSSSLPSMVKPFLLLRKGKI